MPVDACVVGSGNREVGTMGRSSGTLQKEAVVMKENSLRVYRDDRSVISR
jgi:hypothetical protein